MNTNGKLMDMLVGYASAHQHSFNIAVHLLGIPTIMLGVFIPLSWINADLMGGTVNLAYITAIGMFVFYLTLDKLFSFMFLLYALPIAYLATKIGAGPLTSAATVAAAAFFGGYLTQFIGHAVEKSVPVILKHPLQANLAAPFFIVVEIFKILRLRENLFDSVQREIAIRRNEQKA
jgi:uncharacterized membrane protein YGL010W